MDDIAPPNDNIRHLNRQPSIIGAVLEHIKSKKQATAAIDSDTDIEDDDDEEEEDSD